MGGGNGGQGAGAGGTDEGAVATGTPAPAPSDYGAGQFKVQTFPVVVDGQKVATAEIYSGLGMRQAAESAYQSALTQNLVIVGAAAAVVAFLISLFVSRRITAPLEELTDAAADVATGDFGVRVAPRGNDEVGALATAFNAMADRLARDEQWRRDMTADLSHELRTPLATIQTRIEALEDGVLPATPENLRVIGAEVERLGRLLGALRNLNELESEDLDVQHEPLDLARGGGRRGGAGGDGVRGQGRRPRAPGWQSVTVKADRDRLLQVAGNLLDNALKFTPPGGRVEVAVGRGAAPTPDEADDMSSHGFSVAGRSGRCSPSATAARASTPSTCPSCSTGSTAPSRRAPRRASASGSPSPAVSSRPRGASSRRPTGRRAEPCSPSASPSWGEAAGRRASGRPRRGR